MATSQAKIQPTIGMRFMEMLYIPWVDKTIAVIAIVPNAIGLYFRYTNSNLNFVRAVTGIHVLILIVTMIFRRTPVRVTPNPWYWLLAFVATYGIFVFTTFGQTGVPLVPTVIPDVLAITSAALMIYARLSLGRSIGFVPADRGIITRGAYRFVRHPIYTALFLSLAALTLRSYTPLNAAAALTIFALFVIKSIVEERFLSKDDAYAEYRRRVRWRWIPGIA
jgi:protein-S-isoprenylcysteine O-methyltransferase Ste14